MKRLLHGEWLGHPLHPVFVHLPVALWPAALVFDLLTQAGFDGAVLVRMAFWAILIGLVGAGLAIPPGLADWSEVGRDKPAWKIGLYHMLLNLTAGAVWALNLALRVLEPADLTRTPPVPLALSVLGTGLVAVSAYLGGRLVYDQGTFVGWMGLKQRRRRAEAAGNRVPAEE